LALLAILAPLCTVHAACTITQFTASGVTAQYEPFSNRLTAAAIAITVRGNADCKNKSVALALVQTPQTPVTGSPFVLSDGGSNQIKVEITGQGGQAMPVSGSLGSAFMSPQFALTLGAAGGLQNGNALHLTVPAGQAVPPGDYTGQLSLYLCVLDAGQCNSATAIPAALTPTVHVRQSLLLAALSSRYIDVGELKPGATGGPVSFDAYANIKYALILISDHDFALAPWGQGRRYDSVPYLPYISGEPVDRSSTMHGYSHARKIDFAVPGGSGIRHHLFSVKILPFHDLPAGHYSDVLTICIRAQA
jgi:hypothetical protein